MKREYETNENKRNKRIVYIFCLFRFYFVCSVFSLIHLNYSLVIASSRLSITRETAVHAARSSICVPRGSGKDRSGSFVARFQGFNSPATNRARCLCRRPSRCAVSCGAGCRASTRRKRKSNRCASVDPPSLTVFNANALAASTNNGSFKVVNACIGVFERERRTQDISPFGTSNVCSIG